VNIHILCFTKNKKSFIKLTPTLLIVAHAGNLTKAIHFVILP
jgi:hypothetical protein